MGWLYYDRASGFEIDDRTLAHLQVVIITKLRRRESFSLELHDGRHLTTVWLSETTPLEFRYSGNRQPALNQAWAEVMAEDAGLHGCLRIRPEPLFTES